MKPDPMTAEAFKVYREQFLISMLFWFGIAISTIVLGIVRAATGNVMQLIVTVPISALGLWFGYRYYLDWRRVSDYWKGMNNNGL